MRSDKCRRHALQHKLVLWTLILMVVPTTVCAFWSSRIARRVISDTHVRNVSTLAQTVATALAGRIDNGWSPEADDIIDGLAIDSRLAFITVTDNRGHLIKDRTVDAAARTSFTRWRAQAEQRGIVELASPIVLGQAGDLVAMKVPIWNPPVGLTNHQRSRVPDSTLQGFALLALREQSMTKSLAHLHTMQLIGVLAICLISLPVAVYATRRWTAPVRALLDATIELGSGAIPQLVRVASDDELGQLAEAFNQMAGNLCDARTDLKAANEKLERNVEERTAELQQVNDRLASEIRDKDEFLRAVTHDLAAPLRNIDGMASMMLLKYKQQLADDAVNKLERISANVRTQADLLNDLLDLSRIRTRSGKSEIVDVQSVVEQLRETFAHDLECNQITLEIDGSLPCIRADHNRIRQLFQNLVDNAIKYMLDSPIRRIKVSHRFNGDVLAFTVTDTGCGIDEQDLDDVFQVFRRATHAQSQQIGGRGVGLASVKTIVECYGGSVQLDSERGKGTTVFFTIDPRLYIEPETQVAVA